MSRREIIEWHEVTEQMPDDGITVLIHTPRRSEPVWLGWHEDGCWFQVDGAEIVDETVDRWAHVPTGDQELRS